jgi:tetratricopeptide (TPR) repeat protein
MFKKHLNTVIFLACLTGIFLLYLHTTFPAFKNDDSPETAAAAYTLGIGHPPSYPLFTMAAKTFTLLPLGSPAFRVNLFSIFLSLSVMFMAFLTVKKNVFALFGRENRAINYLGMFALAFSYIFWNQAIEAKGGIYIMNLLFFSIIVYLGAELLNRHSIRRMYMMAYIYALSLANHWPSMIILLPVPVYFFFRHVKNTGKKQAAALAAFFTAGLSAYLYLPVRAGHEGAFIFMAKPDNWYDFWWTVFRSGFPNNVAPTAALYSRQITGFFRLFINDFSFLWVIGIAGAYASWKNSRKLFNLYIIIFTAIAVAVVFYNRTGIEAAWAQDIFLMPAQYILLLFIPAGAAFIMTRLPGGKALKYLAAVVLAVAVIYEASCNYRENNSRDNYLSYDFGNNVIKTLEPGSMYFPESDYYVMPYCYAGAVERKTGSINYQSLFSLQYPWGIGPFEAKYGASGLEPYNGPANIAAIIKKFAPGNNIYLSSYALALDGKTGGFTQKAKGVLVKIAKENEAMPPRIAESYSYRGIFAARTEYDKNLSQIYGAMMFRQANDIFGANNYRGALEMYTRVLLFPIAGRHGDVYYNMSLCYRSMNDKRNEMEYLRKTVETKPGFWPAYEEAGRLFYESRDMVDAKYMFRQALKYGSPDRGVLEGYLRE